MSFGGAVAAMILSLKNNKRNRASLFEKEHSQHASDNGKPFVDHKKITPEIREAILQRLSRQRKIRRFKVYGVTTAIVIILLILASLLH